MKPILAESVIVYRSRGERALDILLYETDFGLYMVGAAILFIVIVAICSIVSNIKKKRRW